jgi:hypothetical protein
MRGTHCHDVLHYEEVTPPDQTSAFTRRTSSASGNAL